MKLKKLLAILLTAVALMSCRIFSVSATATTESPPITVKVGGKGITFPDQKPIIKNDCTLIPIRFVAEALGYDVEWDPTDHTAIIDQGRIVIYIGTANAIINGEQTVLEVSSVLIGDRTMIPLQITAEILDCTADWFETNRMVLVNARKKNGTVMSVFERYKQTDLFWDYKTSENEILVWKADYPSLKLASDPEASHKWWIERPIDKSGLDNQSFDCSIMMRTFNAEERNQVRDMLYTAYPTRYREAYDIMMKTICGEIWETFYPETSELYPLFSAVAPRAGTFGTTYYDNREVEMYTDYNGTKFILNISAEGYRNPEKPAKLSDNEIASYTKEAKNRYCLSLWGLK